MFLLGYIYEELEWPSFRCGTERRLTSEPMIRTKTFCGRCDFYTSWNKGIAPKSPEVERRASASRDCLFSRTSTESLCFFLLSCPGKQT